MFRFISEDRQTLFDAAVRHLHTMPRQCMVDNACMYLIPETGERCVIGALVVAETAYDQDALYGLQDTVINLQSRGFFQSTNTRTADMLVKLQDCHDTSSNWFRDKFQARYYLYDIANEQRLNTTLLDSFNVQAQKAIRSFG